MLLVSDPHRFEIRCTPEIRDLVDVLCSLEGDKTSGLVRRLIVAHARDVVKQLDGDDARRVRRALSKIAEAS